MTFGVSDERAWEVGLACGGTIKVFVEPAVRPEVLAAARGPGGEVVATVVEGAAPGVSMRVLEDGRMEGDLGPGVPSAAVREAAIAALQRERSTTVPVRTPAGETSVFLEVFPRQPRLVIFGGVDSERPWRREEKLRFVCPVPGYDRHITLLERLGIEMVTVPMHDDVPDA